jgi:hypothetical protein
MGFVPFVESFVIEVIWEDFNIISYAQCPSSLLHIIFLSLVILQHYVEYDSCTIVTLEKLLGVGSFNTIAGHLAHF